MFESDKKKEENRIKAMDQKMRSDLLTAFMGKGKRGLYQWLRLGNFLSPLLNDEDRYYHNDRCGVIGCLIGEDNMDKLLMKLCDGITELSREEE